MSGAGDPSGEREASPLWLHALVAGAVFAGFFVWTWGRWPDPWIDFGRELYVPWRLAEGDRLGRDLAWFNGPLSPSWNALLFRLFGVGFSTLVWANAVTFAGILTLLHAALRSFTSRAAATLAVVVVVATCGFAQLVGVGNYNYIAPYSHEVTHGLLLALAALCSARRARGAELTGGPAWDRSWAWWWATGAAVGLAFLTKPEIFVAAAAGVGGGMLAGGSRSVWRRRLVAGVAGAAIPIFAAWMLLASTAGARGAARLVAGAWPGLWSTDVGSSFFYRALSGFDRPLDNLRTLAVTALALVATLAPAAWVAMRPRERTGGRRVLAVVLTLAGVIAYAGLAAWLPWQRMARPWPLFALVIAVWCCLRVRREPGDVRWASALAFAVFALAMTAKILLATRIAHYGFALAMPATALLVAVGFDGVGRFVDSRGGDVVAWRSAFAIALVAFVVPHVAATARARAGKVVEVGNGADRFLADARGTVLRDVLVALARRPPGTLVVVPEGVMVDYLARAKNPTPFVNFMPPELALFGEAVMLEALRTKPPDRILVTHKSTAEYGVPWFGRDYAPALAVWIDAEYQAVELFGDPPLRPESRFGAALLERRAASARVPSTRQGRTLRTEGRATPRAPEGSPALGSL